MSKYSYNPWPLGKLPKEWQRPEPELIREKGYNWEDPRDIVAMFEEKLAKYAGSKYAITTDCCTNGLFLCLKYWKDKSGTRINKIRVPKRTYVSVPMQVLNVGWEVGFDDNEWEGVYRLAPTLIYDYATRFTKDMYREIAPAGMAVLSFQIKKRLPIGRGGAILTDNVDFYKWAKRASYDGRDLTLPYTDPNHITQMGWHFYMTPEDAARGILLMDQLPERNEDTGSHLNYTDLSELPIFQKKETLWKLSEGQSE